MGRITSNVGLITGIPITDTVDQLIGVASQSRDQLTTRTQGLQQQQLAITTLSSRLLGLKFDLGRLNVSTPFQARSVSSQNEELLTASVASEGQPPLGNFSLRPAQTAGSQQLISQRFESLDDIESTGSLGFGFGGFVDKGVALDELNNGAGVTRGEIKITDLAGNSAVVDLSLARTVDDVLSAINNETALNVSVSADSNGFTLSDTVGGTGTLSVQEVSSGTTAADLGLAGISTTASSATGSDVYGLHTGTKLSELNDGNGVRFLAGLDDLKITLRDGDELGIDLSGSNTVGDILDAINNDADNAGRLTASIGPDGNRIVLTNSALGSENFAVGNTDDALGLGSAADDLGLSASIAANTITGGRLSAGLRGTLVSSLQGGAGIDLDKIDVTDRSGATATIDLSGLETIQEIIDTINAQAGVDVVASINASRNGLEITDASGGSGNLIIANEGAGTTADDLGIVINAAVDSSNSGSLNRQALSQASLLASLQGGQGIVPSDIRITDSSGQSAAIDLNGKGNEAETIGDVIDAINGAEIGVQASINDTGDGILLVDTAAGEETLVVSDINGTLAAELNLTRTSETVDIEGSPTQVIDGTSQYRVDLSDLAASASSISLASLNDGAGIDASDIRITDSEGNITILDLNATDADIATVEQLIEAINDRSASGANVEASINSAGTGIKLTDNSNGTGSLQVEDVNGTAAADLKILSTDATVKSINGSGLFAAQSASQGALAAVASNINNLEAGVTASVLNDGLGFRLQLVVDDTGAANEILLDASVSGFTFEETSSARDALLVVGAGAKVGSGVLVSSSTNEFEQVINGVDLTAVAASKTAVDVTVAKTDEDLVSAVEKFVDSYNTLRSELDDLTDFNEDDLSTGLLFGTNEALRVDTELSRIVTDRYFGVGRFQSLEAIGIGVDDSGKLELDKSKLQESFAEDAQSLQTFFTAKDRGIVAKFEAAIESLAGADNGLLTNRDDSLQATIDANEARIERFNESLDRQRERLLLQFFQLEQVISNLQTSQQAVNSFQSVAPLSIGN